MCVFYNLLIYNILIVIMFGLYNQKIGYPQKIRERAVSNSILSNDTALLTLVVTACNLFGVVFLVLAYLLFAAWN